MISYLNHSPIIALFYRSCLRLCNKIRFNGLFAYLHQFTYLSNVEIVLAYSWSDNREPTVLEIPGHPYTVPLYETLMYTCTEIYVVIASLQCTVHICTVPTCTCTSNITQVQLNQYVSQNYLMTAQNNKFFLLYCVFFATLNFQVSYILYRKQI